MSFIPKAKPAPIASVNHGDKYHDVNKKNSPAKLKWNHLVVLSKKSPKIGTPINDNPPNASIGSPKS